MMTLPLHIGVEKNYHSQHRQPQHQIHSAANPLSLSHINKLDENVNVNMNSYTATKSFGTPKKCSTMNKLINGFYFFDNSNKNALTSTVNTNKNSCNSAFGMNKNNVRITDDFNDWVRPIERASPSKVPTNLPYASNTKTLNYQLSHNCACRHAVKCYKVL